MRRDDPLREDVPRHAAQAGVHEHRDRRRVQDEADQQLHAPADGARVGTHPGQHRASIRALVGGRSREPLRAARTRRGATPAAAGAPARPAGPRATAARPAPASSTTDYPHPQPHLHGQQVWSACGIAWNSHFWHSGPMTIDDLPADRRISGLRLDAVLGAWQRPGPAYVALADALRAAILSGVRPAEHPPAQRARARRRRRACPAPPPPPRTGCCATRATWSAGAARARSPRSRPARARACRWRSPSGTSRASSTSRWRRRRPPRPCTAPTSPRSTRSPATCPARATRRSASRCCARPSPAGTPSAARRRARTRS